MDSFLKKVLLATHIVFLLFAVGFFLKIARSFLIPFVLALFLYFLFSPLIDLLCRLRVPRWAALVIVILMALGLVTLLGIITYTGISALAVGLPKYQTKLEPLFRLADSLAERIPEFSLPDMLRSINLGAISSFVLKTMGSFMKFFTSVSLMILFFIFMLVGKGNLERKILRAFPPHQAQHFIKIYTNLIQKIYRYLWIKTLISILTGINVWIILSIFGIDFAFIWGFLTFVFNYIPNIGSIIITIPPVLLAALKFGRLLPVLWLVLLLVLNQMFMGNFLEPRWMGKSLNLSPLLVLFSLIFWGWLWGVVGMIISVPLLSIIKIILENIPQTASIAKLMEA